MKKIIQFGYSVQVPQGIPLVDCRTIENPYPKYKDPVAARNAVRRDPNFNNLVMQVLGFLQVHDVVGVGCAYGVHRSGAVVEELERISEYNIQVEKVGKA